MASSPATHRSQRRTGRTWHLARGLLFAESSGAHFCHRKSGLGSVAVSAHSAQSALLRQMLPGKARDAGNGGSLAKSRNAAWRHLPRNPKGRAGEDAMKRQQTRARLETWAFAGLPAFGVKYCRRAIAETPLATAPLRLFSLSSALDTWSIPGTT